MGVCSGESTAVVQDEVQHCGRRVSVQGFQLGLVKQPHTFGIDSVPRGCNE